VEWPLLEGLSATERQTLLGLTHRRAFGRGEMVCRAGEPADSLHLVERGHLAVRGILPSGHSATLNVLSAGDYFGELGLLRTERRRTATVVSMEPSSTLSIAAKTFSALCAGNPQVARALSVLLADRIDKLSGRLLETMYVSLDRRVYRRLVELGESYGVREDRATVPLSQSDLADLVGATRPSVNQILRRLADQGLVELHRGRVELLHVSALRRRCAQ
jgi:CRP-like cAMP-binding protein